MMDLRIRNMEKIHNDGVDARFCVCRKSAAGFMLQCELCKDWFHGKSQTLYIIFKLGLVCLYCLRCTKEFYCSKIIEEICFQQCVCTLAGQQNMQNL